jgi:hypothetical protein
MRYSKPKPGGNRVSRGVNYARQCLWRQDVVHVQRLRIYGVLQSRPQREA